MPKGYTVVKQSRFPGWRTMTAAQRYNAKMHELFEDAKRRGAWDRLDECRKPLDTTQGEQS